MRSVTMICVLAFIKRACAKERKKKKLNTGDVQFIDKLVDKLLDRSIINKLGHVATPSRAIPRPALQLGARQHSTSIDATPSSAGSQSVRKAMLGHRKQLLQFIEPKTKVNVQLVGVMHYNPASDQLTSNAIEKLAQDGKLGSVVLEMCDVRWESLSRQENPILRGIQRSEMETACDLALSYNRSVVLGDQRINVTISRIKTALEETLSDLVLPMQGWRRIATNITKAWEDSLAVGGNQYLNAFAFLDLELLLGTPVTLFKYFLSYLTAGPLSTILLAVLLVLTDPIADWIRSEDQVTWVDYAASLGLATLNTAAFIRIIVKAILQERNKILAKSILQQCRLYEIDHRRNGKQFPSIQQRSTDITYVSGSTIVAKDEREAKTVVAILGLVHCNAIMKLLTEQQID